MSRFNDVLNKKAVALAYDEKKNNAPIIVASGMGYIAEKMVEVARESGVPIYEDNSLATMLTQLNLGAEIPTELYQAIIDIYVYFLDYVPGKREEKIGEAMIDEHNGEQTGSETGAAGPVSGTEVTAAEGTAEPAEMIDEPVTETE